MGITRAKRELYLTYARTRALFGDRDWNLRSRFVDEIPIELTDRDADAPTGPRGRRHLGRRRAAAAPEPRGAGSDASRSATTWCTPTSARAWSSGVEPGGLVVVRFAGDGSERKLMADYAPLKKRS